MDRATELLKKVYKLIEDGELVRNTDKDRNLSDFLRQSTTIINTLAEVQQFLKDQEQ